MFLDFELSIERVLSILSQHPQFNLTSKKLNESIISFIKQNFRFIFLWFLVLVEEPSTNSLENKVFVFAVWKKLFEVGVTEGQKRFWKLCSCLQFEFRGSRYCSRSGSILLGRFSSSHSFKYFVFQILLKIELSYSRWTSVLFDIEVFWRFFIFLGWFSDRILKPAA